MTSFGISSNQDDKKRLTIPTYTICIYIHKYIYKIYTCIYSELTVCQALSGYIIIDDLPYLQNN